MTIAPARLAAAEVALIRCGWSITDTRRIAIIEMIEAADAAAPKPEIAKDALDAFIASIDNDLAKAGRDPRWTREKETMLSEYRSECLKLRVDLVNARIDTLLEARDAVRAIPQFPDRTSPERAIQRLINKATAHE